MLKKFAQLSLFFVFLVGSRAQAEEEIDRGSRTIRSSKKGPKKALGFDYHLGIFTGVFVEDERLGLLSDIGIGSSLALNKKQTISAKLSYLHDPFSAKSFNFSDESISADPKIAIQRIAQKIDELELQLRWNSKWSKDWKSNIVLDLDARWPSFATDQRFSIALRPQVRYGKKRGFFVKTLLKIGYVAYPEYLISGRELNQNREGLKLESGWVFKGRSSISAGFETNFTQYLNAKYDAQNTAGDTIDAVDSKSYRSYEPFVNGVWRITKKIKVRGKYKLQIHDSIHYDRDTQGRDKNAKIERRFISNYYDYTRHRLRLDVSAKISKDLKVSLLGEVWTRTFADYEARDADNKWIEEKRTDQSLEVGLETAYRVFSFGEKPFASAIYLTGLVSLLKRSSNMEREVSFATNYDVTRLFLGLEFRSK